MPFDLISKPRHGQEEGPGPFISRSFCDSRSGASKTCVRKLELGYEFNANDNGIVVLRTNDAGSRIRFRHGVLAANWYLDFGVLFAFSDEGTVVVHHSERAA